MTAESENGDNDQHAVSLSSLDLTLEQFAAHHTLTFEKVDGEAPRRLFRSDGPIERHIELHFDGDNDGKWYVWVCASEERIDGRYWKKRNLKGPVSIAELQFDLNELLDAAWQEVSGWTDAHLENE